MLCALMSEIQWTDRDCVVVSRIQIKCLHKLNCVIQFVLIITRYKKVIIIMYLQTLDENVMRAQNADGDNFYSKTDRIHSVAKWIWISIKFAVQFHYISSFSVHSQAPKLFMRYENARHYTILFHRWWALTQLKSFLVEIIETILSHCCNESTWAWKKGTFPATALKHWYLLHIKCFHK